MGQTAARQRRPFPVCSTHRLFKTRRSQPAAHDPQGSWRPHFRINKRASLRRSSPRHSRLPTNRDARFHMAVQSVKRSVRISIRDSGRSKIAQASLTIPRTAGAVSAVSYISPLNHRGIPFHAGRRHTEYVSEKACSATPPLLQSVPPDGYHPPSLVRKSVSAPCPHSLMFLHSPPPCLSVCNVSLKKAVLDLLHFILYFCQIPLLFWSI